MNKAEKTLDKLIDLLKCFCNNSCCDFCCLFDEGKCMFKEILGTHLSDFDPKDVQNVNVMSSINSDILSIYNQLQTCDWDHSAFDYNDMCCIDNTVRGGG